MKRRVVLTTLVTVLVISSLMIAGPASAVREPQVTFWLTVLHNNDGESDLIDLGAGLEDFGGVARFKTVVDSLRAEAITGPRPPDQRSGKRGAITVSSGDNFLPGPEFNASLDKGVPFYDTIAMDLIGYDAVAIGNHDFDFGPDVLADFISGYERTSPTYLSANLVFDEEARLLELMLMGRIAKSTVVKERGELIGLIGATTPMLRYISSPRNVGIIDDVAAVVQAEVAKLERQGVNKIVLISHLQTIEEDIELVSYLEGVDVVVAGGGDEVLANPGDLLIPGHESVVYGPYPMVATDSDGRAVPVVTTAGSYAYVGRLVVGFDRHGNVVATGHNSGPVRVAGGDNPDAVKPDPMVQALVVDPVVAALAALADNVLAVSEVPLNGLRTDVRTVETNLGNLMADSMLWQATQLAPMFGVPAPDVALQNGGGIRNASVIPAGPVTELDTFAIAPFSNFVSVVPGVPRDQFKLILENAVSRVEFGDGRFAQVAGFSFVWDAAQPAGSRVREAMLDDGTILVAGGAVVAGDPLTIATIDFLARGGDQYPYDDAPFTTIGVTYQQGLENYLVDGLGGQITAVDYPDGGEGRITRLN
ncbi:MAG: bifunctional metallophosphatase/5'-nucleotidase [Anaerosomatales bacterium]